jgi:hypothetical protein
MGHLGMPNIVASLQHARLVPGAWCLVPGMLGHLGHLGHLFLVDPNDP